jgi:hypothetical protein
MIRVLYLIMFDVVACKRHHEVDFRAQHPAEPRVDLLVGRAAFPSY